MDNGDADILAGIRELRAKATAQLTGNDYYMIVQQLDQLTASAELSGETARSQLSRISGMFGGGGEVLSATGDPEIPPTPDTPAEPVPPPGPDAPVIPDSPAQPDNPPGPDIPSPVDSPAEMPTPPEMMAPIAAASEEGLHIISPRASSFGSLSPTVAIRTVEVPSEPEAAAADAEAPEPAAPANHASGLSSAVMAARTLIEEKLSGNSYYAAATLLGQLQILPSPPDGEASAARPEGFDGALALLRQEAAHMTGMAHEEAVRIIAALENVLMPEEPVAATAAEAAPAQAQPEEAASEPDAVASEAESQPEAEAEPEIVASEADAEPEIVVSEPEAEPEIVASETDEEPEPRTGFDDLAEASWRRVQQLSAAEAKPVHLNGGVAPASVLEAVAAAPASVVEAVAAAASVVEPTAAEPAASGEAEAPPEDDVAVTAAADKPAPAIEADALLMPAVEVAPDAALPEAAQAEMMESDIGEAFNDGGSESRSSEPCSLHEFELADARHGASHREEPAADAGADAAPEAQREAAVPADEPVEVLTASAETDLPAQDAPHLAAGEGARDEAATDEEADMAAELDADEMVASASPASEPDADAPAEVPASAPEPDGDQKPAKPAPAFEAELLEPAIEPSPDEIADVIAPDSGAPEGSAPADQPPAEFETGMQAETPIAATSAPETVIDATESFELAGAEPVEPQPEPETLLLDGSAAAEIEAAAAAGSPEIGEPVSAGNAADAAPPHREAPASEAIAETPLSATVESAPASVDHAPAAPIVTAASAAIAAETRPSEPTIELTQAEKPTRRGFFGRLFGGASADNG